MRIILGGFSLIWLSRGGVNRMTIDKMLISSFALAIILVACTTEDNPFEMLESEIQKELSVTSSTRSASGSREENNDSSYDYHDNYSSPVASSYGNYSYYSSSSVSGNYSTTSGSDYLVSAKTIYFTLTYFEQTSMNWDPSSKSYTDGDPNISFELYFIQVNGSKVTFSTKKDISKKWFYKEDIGSWEGRQTFTTTVPVNTDTIKVCPTVIDVDFDLNDDKSSHYCYGQGSVGRIRDRIIKQSDSESENYILKWEWYLE